MPFQIELRKKRNNVIIKLQIAKNTISFYFNGPDHRTLKATINHCLHIESQFIATIPGFNSEWVREDEEPRFNSQTNEIESLHFHTEFNTVITPLVLASYLRAFYQRQLAHKLSPYNLFVNSHEVAEVINSYRHYYNLYKDFLVERLYEEQAKHCIPQRPDYPSLMQSIVTF